MKEYAPDIRASELSLVDVPSAFGRVAARADDAIAVGDTAAVTSDASPVGDMAAVTNGASAAGIDSERVPPAASEDRFLAKAAKELAAGHVEPPLWARAVAQAGSDTALATRLYLESRATA